MLEGRLVWETDPLRKLDGVKKGIRNRAVKIAMSKAAASVKAAVISAAPERYGFLKKSIRIKIKGYNDGLQWIAVIGAASKYRRSKGKYTRGPSKGLKRFFRPAFYLSIVDQGTSHAKGYKFMSRALNSSIAQYQATLAEAVEQQIQKLLAAG